MKKVFLLTILALSVSYGAYAMPQKKGERRHSVNRIMKQLDLTGEQQTKMKSLRKDFRAKLETVDKDPTLTREARRLKRGEIRQSQRDSVVSILTAEQQAKRKDIQTRGHRNRKGYGNSSRHDASRFGAETGAKLDSLRVGFRKQVRSVKMSRIAPEMQKKRIEDLTIDYRKERKQIIQKTKSVN